MHIPSEMLSGSVCPVTAALSIAGVAASVGVLLRRGNAIPRARDFALTGAAVFALQMLNYPIGNGISAHLVGGVLASALLGVPAGVLCLASVLLVQTLLFADGGLPVLGANVFNMAIVGAGVGGLLNALFRSRGFSRGNAAFFAAALSVISATLALSAELSASGKASAETLGVLLGAHALPALVEGLATAALLALLRSPETSPTLSRRGFSVLGGGIVAALLAAPFASVYPDAFEWTMARFSLLPNAPNFAHAPFADYLVPALGNGALSAILAGTVGVATLLAFGFVFPKILRRASAKNS